MKKIFSLIQLAVLSAGSSAFALVGGPFDNGDYSILLERAGYYQASYSFKNGSGYSLWSPDNLQGSITQGQTVTPNIGSGALATPNGQANNANRTVIYYKGVTYFGGAFGEVDVQKRRISGYANASSEFTANVTQNQQQNNLFFGQSNVSQTNSTSVVASGRSYVANVNWKGKVTATQPQLRFNGTGELAIISPTGQSAIAGLAYDGYSQLISSIAQSVAQGQGVDNDTFISIDGDLNPTVGAAIVNSLSPYTAASAAIQNSLTALTPYLTGTGPQSSFEESEAVKIKVSGYRRFF